MGAGCCGSTSVTHVHIEKTMAENQDDHQPLSVPKAGIEPARIAPLVFETSASTDSAIWAFARQIYDSFFNFPNF